jgi:hypothetical protein
MLDGGNISIFYIIPHLDNKMLKDFQVSFQFGISILSLDFEYIFLKNKTFENDFLVEKK